jgi:EAL domain-containing protein (putative c-di-GMP-specific phosphodiesterase class I)
MRRRARLSPKGDNISAVEALVKLWIAYQPIVDANSYRPMGYEAFVRCDEPGLGEPAALFAIAERLGTTAELGRAIRTRIAQDLANAPRDPRVFVNLHPAEMGDDALYCASEPLREHARRIVFEITESAALHKVEHLTARMNGDGRCSSSAATTSRASSMAPRHGASLPDRLNPACRRRARTCGAFLAGSSGRR